MIDGIFYQHAYVTPDVGEAVARLTAAADVREVIEFEGTSEVWTPNGSATLVAKFGLVWVEDVQYELIQPVSDPERMYTTALESGKLLTFHHTAFRVANWDSFRPRVQQQPYPVAMERSSGDLRFLYLDTRPLLGHHVEYVCTTDELWRRTGGR